jgi:hypothetical protein
VFLRPRDPGICRRRCLRFGLAWAPWGLRSRIRIASRPCGQEALRFDIGERRMKKQLFMLAHLVFG